MGNDELTRLYKPQKVQPAVTEGEVKTEKTEPKTEEVIEETVVTIPEIEGVEELKKEQIDDDDVKVTDIIPLDDVVEPAPPPPPPPPIIPPAPLPQTVEPSPVDILSSLPPPEKKPKMEYFSENSEMSLPGVSSDQGNQPVGFEPGMFGKGKGESTTEEGEMSRDKAKKKKKDKKKHKHKHKKHKDKDKEKDKRGESSFQTL